MRRRLYFIASALSLLLFVATAAVWARSYHVQTAVGYNAQMTADGAYGIYYFCSPSGRLAYVWMIQNSAMGGTPGQFFYYDVHDAGEPVTANDKRFAGFEYHAESWQNGHWGSVAAPFWFIEILLAAAATTCGIQARRSRSFAASCCQACGYNLTGNASGVCPECGEHLVGRSPASIV